MISFLKQKAYRIKKSMLPKVRLNNDTIIIEPNSWRKFSALDWKCQYRIEKCYLEQIDMESRKNIIAYIGSIEPSQLKTLPCLKWLQLPSHGSNGFDDKKLFSSENVVVSSLKGIYSRSIAQFCIAAFYLANTYALSRKLPNFEGQGGGI